MVVFSDPAFAALTWDTSKRGTRLDLTGYKQTFRDDFNSLSISGSNGVGTKWFSPARDNYGAGVFKEFVPPPVQLLRVGTSSGELVMRMEKAGDIIQSAHIQTINRLNQGWTQSLGYFQAKMRFQKGAAVWPAFWLLSPTEPRVEVDTVEAYGGSDFDGHHTTLHLNRTYHPSKYTGLTGVKDPVTGLPMFAGRDDMFDGKYHAYGSLLTPEWIITYYDGFELARFPMTSYFQVPLYMNVSLAALPQEKDLFVSPKEIGVDYVVAFAKI